MKMAAFNRFVESYRRVFAAIRAFEQRERLNRFNEEIKRDLDHGRA